MSDLRNAIRAAKDAKETQGLQNPESKAIPENQKTRKPESQPQETEMVNLTIKVSREQRMEWLIAAKKERTSLTAAIIEALQARFGDANKT